jgi:hypothetical protein
MTRFIVPRIPPSSSFLSVHALLGSSVYNASKALTQASAVTVALAGFAPVTTLPSVIVNASQGPSGLTYVAPALAALDSIVAAPHSLIFSTCPRSSSPLVVKPVTFLPEMIDFLVVESRMPGKIAPPWQLCTNVRMWMKLGRRKGRVRTLQK